MTGLTAAELHELVAYGRVEQLEQIVHRTIGQATVVVRVPAESALTMVRIRETVAGELFNVGEVLVTRCEVEVNGMPGWATVVGDDRQRALCGALLDAADRHGALAGAHDELADALEGCRADRRERWAAVQPTRVEFEEMAP